MLNENFQEYKMWLHKKTFRIDINVSKTGHMSVTVKTVWVHSYLSLFMHCCLMQRVTAFSLCIF